MDQYLIPKKCSPLAPSPAARSMTVIGGNFGLAMNASHYFEAFRLWWMNARNGFSVALGGSRGESPRGNSFSDRGGSVRVTTRSGHRLYVEAGTDQGHGLFVVYGTRLGRIEVDELTGRLHAVVRKREHRSLPTASVRDAIGGDRSTDPRADVVGPTQRGSAYLGRRRGFSRRIRWTDGGRGPRGSARVAEQAGRVIDLDVDPLPTARCFPWA